MFAVAVGRPKCGPCGGWKCGRAADWVEPWVHVRELGGRTRLNAISLSLSFSRIWSVQWRLDQGQLSWQEAHNRAFEAVQGVPWSVRFDNCRTASWASCPTPAGSAGPPTRARSSGGCATCAGI